MIGETYFHQESYEAAIAAYLRVEILFAYPQWQAGALLQAGKCQEHLGRWKDAAETYARQIQAYPDTEYTDEAKPAVERGPAKNGRQTGLSLFTPPASSNPSQRSQARTSHERAEHATQNVRGGLVFALDRRSGRSNGRGPSRRAPGNGQRRTADRGDVPVTPPQRGWSAAKICSKSCGRGAC